MSTFFRKRPPYTLRSEHTLEHDDDFPVIGPASDNVDEHNYPILEAETESIDDFPVVGPAAEAYYQEEEVEDYEEELAVVAPITAATVSPKKVAPRQFSSSDKLQLPQAPKWVQEQAHSSHNTISPQLENAIKVIINDEMEQAEKRIQQRILNELNNYF